MKKTKLTSIILAFLLATAAGCSSGQAPAATTTTAAQTTTTTTAAETESDDDDVSDEDEDEYEYEDEDEDSDDDSSEYDYDDDSEDSDYNDYDNSGSGSGGFPFDASLGSAKELEGNVVVFSVFVKDNATTWNFSDLASEPVFPYIGAGLSVSAKYLTDAAAKYGKNVNFIYNWDEHPELFHCADLDFDYRNTNTEYDDLDNKVWEFIENDIDTASILQQNDAQQAIYMLYFNTPTDNNITCCSRPYYENMEYPYELCYMFMNYQNQYACPSFFAHEMLHTFGAPDLYRADETAGITQEYVDYANKINLNDIMRMNEDPATGNLLYDSIANDITDITAYYVGLTSQSDTVDEWGFGPSEHK